MLSPRLADRMDGLDRDWVPTFVDSDFNPDRLVYWVIRDVIQADLIEVRIRRSRRKVDRYHYYGNWLNEMGHRMSRGRILSWPLQLESYARPWRGVPHSVRMWLWLQACSNHDWDRAYHVMLPPHPAVLHPKACKVFREARRRAWIMRHYSPDPGDWIPGLAEFPSLKDAEDARS